MTSNIDFGTSDATMLTMEMDEISFAGLLAGATLSMAFTVASGGTTLDTWSQSYTADSKGNIRIPALGRMWNRYLIAHRRTQGGESSTPTLLPDVLDVTLTYTLGIQTATCTRHLYYSRRRPSLTLLSLTNKLPMLSKEKHTFATAKETICTLKPMNTLEATITAIYVKNGAQHTYSGGASWTSEAIRAKALDVSPSVVAALLPTGAQLMEYTVTLVDNYAIPPSSDSCRYIVDGHGLKQQLVWLNRWGIYEYLALMGAKTLDSEHSAEFGFAGDEWSALDMDVTDEYEASTGYVTDREWNQVRDIAESPIVWLWDGTSYHKITVTGAKLSRTYPSNEARACVVTFRLADREALPI